MQVTHMLLCALLLFIHCFLPAYAKLLMDIILQWSCLHLCTLLVNITLQFYRLQPINARCSYTSHCNVTVHSSLPVTNRPRFLLSYITADQLGARDLLTQSSLVQAQLYRNLRTVITIYHAYVPCTGLLKACAGEWTGKTCPLSAY